MDTEIAGVVENYKQVVNLATLQNSVFVYKKKSVSCYEYVV